MKKGKGRWAIAALRRAIECKALMRPSLAGLLPKLEALNTHNTHNALLDIPVYLFIERASLSRQLVPDTWHLAFDITNTVMPSSQSNLI